MMPEAPPHDIATESAALGAMLLDYEQAERGLRQLTSAHFYHGGHEILFEAIGEVVETEQTVDLVCVKNHLKAAGHLEKVGGVATLQEHTERVPYSGNLPKYIAELDRFYHKRRIRQIRQQLEDAERCDVDTQEALAELEDAIDGIRSSGVDDNVKTLYEHLEDESEQITREIEGEAIGLQTGFGRLDESIGGLLRGSLNIICAARSVGKTAMAANMLCDVGIRQGKPVLFFSAEVGGGMLSRDMARCISGVNLWNIRHGLTAEELGRFQRAQELIRDAPIYVDDTPNIQIEQLVPTARKYRKEQLIELIAVDYIQLLQTGQRTESESLRVTHIGNELKRLARLTEVPVVALSQITYSQGRRKTFYARALEHAADIIIYLERTDDEYDEKPEMEPAETERSVVIGKGRHQGTGYYETDFDGTTLRFGDVNYRSWT